MCKKMFKSVFLIGLGLFLVAFLLFGSSAGNFISSSVKHVRGEVADNIPIEFELERAKNLLEEIIPEMTANIQLISQEEVEIAALKSEIDSNIKPLALERRQIEDMSQQMAMQKTVYKVGGHQFTRQEMTEELSNRFERFKESEVLQQSRSKMLETRQQALVNAIQKLSNTRQNKQLLENKIAALESQYRLIQASSVGTAYSIDNSSIAKTEKLIGQIKKRLDVAERVLANKGKFLEKQVAGGAETNEIDDVELISQINDYFNPDLQGSTADQYAGVDSHSVQNAVATKMD